ncbi:hem peroxidase [Dillenia turbinata]|uniref:Peroxidase n=1 Tax=Dillenia turbinata TaxID=194707 RepID=A0AAN8UEJ3_9MAGN
MKTICLVVVCFLFMAPLAWGQLRVGFYSSSCPKAESIIRQVVQQRFGSDRSITAALLRMHFHDCFVRGCDASLLIDSNSTNTKSSEKDAGANQTVRGFELIDEIKKILEAQCPSTVSCADIITVATRDAVALAGGPNYNIPTGRRDGLVSNPSEVDLPGPDVSVAKATKIFKSKGFNANEMVTLLGAHTVGVAHCGFFGGRLSNFQGSGAPDPTMDPTLAAKLLQTCGTTSEPITQDPTAFLYQNTSFIVDNQFYNQILQKRGILQIDQALALDSSTRPVVSSFATNGMAFQQSFAKAMVKMGKVQILVGNTGEIRKNCRAFNPPK